MQQVVQESIWKNANALVDTARPGDFNQSLMELGAKVCTPKNPGCHGCPVQDHCLAFADVVREAAENRNKLSNISKIDILDIEDCLLGKFRRFFLGARIIFYYFSLWTLFTQD